MNSMSSNELPAFSSVLDEAGTVELLGRIRSGDEAGWHELYRRYHDELLFAVRAHLGRGLRSALESEDVLQSVALEALRAVPNFEHRGPGSLRHYLHKMIVNKIRDRADYFGAQKRAGTVPLTPQQEAGLTHAASEPQYFDGDRFERLERALRALPDDMQRIVVLRRVDGLSSKEAADALGKSDVAARKLYSRAIARLTELLR